MTVVDMRSSGAAFPGGDYDPSVFRRLPALEDSHFWFRARSRVLEGIVGRWAAGGPAAARVLEIGCGTGNVLRLLERVCGGCTVVGLDPFMEALDLARRRTACPLVRGGLMEMPFGRVFDLVCLLDVLEHLEDDLEALRRLGRVLKPGGWLILTVPAHMSLWSAFDRASGHRRRYSCAGLAGLLHRAGFEVEFLTPFMSVALPLVWAARRWRLGGARGADALAEGGLKVVPLVNGLLRLLLGWEGWWLAGGRRLPWGSSLLAVAVPRTKSGGPP